MQPVQFPQCIRYRNSPPSSHKKGMSYIVILYYGQTGGPFSEEGVPLFTCNSKLYTIRYHSSNIIHEP